MHVAKLYVDEMPIVFKFKLPSKVLDGQINRKYDPVLGKMVVVKSETLENGSRRASIDRDAMISFEQDKLS